MFVNVFFFFGNIFLPEPGTPRTEIYTAYTSFINATVAVVLRSEAEAAGTFTALTNPDTNMSNILNNLLQFYSQHVASTESDPHKMDS